jgi:outer membrane protein assembly factor BamB
MINGSFAKDPDQASRAMLRRSFAIAASLSGIFFVLVGVLMSASAIQLAINSPLDSPALTQLNERLQADPSDQPLREAIRDLQLLARRAYFSRLRQIETGFHMLAAGFLLFILSLKGWAHATGEALLLRSRTDAHRQDGPRSRLTVLLAGGVILFAVSLVGGIASYGMIRFESGAFQSVGSGQSGQLAEPDRSTRPLGPAELAGPAGSSLALRDRGAGLDEQLLLAFERNWPSFRGPWGRGFSSSSSAAETLLRAGGQAVVWKSLLPKPGFSSPVVWDDMIFLTGGDDAGYELYRFAAADGSLVWSLDVATAFGAPRPSPRVSADTGYAASSPASDGQRVYAIFASGDLLCTDLDGQPLWWLNLGLPDNRYGHSSSLLVYGGTLFVQYDHDGEALLLALDVLTGKELWKVDRDVVTSWASPIMAFTPVGPQLVLNADPYVIAYDPLTGRELWRADCMGGEVAVSAASDGERIYAANQYAVAVAIDPADGRILWENFNDLPEVSTPLAADGLLFMATSYGVVTCRDGRTGELIWETEFDTGFYASPIALGDVLYLVDRSGLVRLIRASRAYEDLGSFELGEACDASPAPVQGDLIFRGTRHLFRIRGKP